VFDHAQHAVLDADIQAEHVLPIVHLEMIFAVADHDAIADGADAPRMVLRDRRRTRSTS
jgi:hypothetical protein